MKYVVAIWLIAFILAVSALSAYVLSNDQPGLVSEQQTAILCILAAGLGGAVYCLRGVYLNACVRQQWSSEWLPWYFIRPFVSLACGLVSYVFLEAGLLVLESERTPGASRLGFYALAFIAGLNVDRFLAKVEDIAQATWGIRPSRASETSSSESSH